MFPTWRRAACRTGSRRSLAERRAEASADGEWYWWICARLPLPLGWDQPVWSPDGLRLAGQREGCVRHAEPHLYVVESDGRVRGLAPGHPSFGTISWQPRP